MSLTSKVAAETTKPDPGELEITINLRDVPGGDRYANFCFFLMLGVYLSMTALEVGYYFGITAFLAPYMRIFTLGAITPDVLKGEIWRPLTATFMHASPVHIGLNLLAFGLIHRFLKNFYGAKSWFWIFILSGYFGGIFASFFIKDPTIGASTGIMGMLGAILATPLRHKLSGLAPDRLPSRNIPVKPLLIGLFMQLMLDNLVPQISGSAHIGGFISGFALSFLFPITLARSLVGSRDIIKITAVNDKGDKRCKPSFENVTFTMTADFDPQKDYVALVSTSHGGIFGKQPTINRLRGRQVLVRDLTGGHVFADEYRVPGYPAPTTTVEEEVQPTTRERLVQFSALTVAWFTIATMLAPALLIPAPNTPWVKLLPVDWQSTAIWYGELAGLVLLSYVLADLVVFLAAQALKRLSAKAKKPSI